MTKHDSSKLTEYTKSSAQREVYSNITPPLKTNKKKLQINNLTLHIKQLEQEYQSNLKVSRRKEILNITAEINEK